VDFSALETALRAAIVTVSGLPERDVWWDGSRQSTGWKTAGGLGATVELKIRTFRNAGQDEDRNVYTATPAPGRVQSRSGSRRLTVQVKVESFRQSGGNTAQALASQIRTRLGRASVVAALKAARIAIADVGPALTADFVVDDRQKSAAIMELLVWAAENDRDTTEGAGNWIETARATNEVGSEVEFDTGVQPPP
jgi:hypothetical protein